jgi:hypothetical protein
MILAGTMTQAVAHDRQLRNVAYVLDVDTSKFVEAITRAARKLMRLDFALEVQGLDEHQVHALMYVRGGLDPDFNDEAARDHYLRAISHHPRVGAVAAAAFLSGWFTHRGEGAKPDPLTWHRLIGDQPVQVSAS